MSQIQQKDTTFTKIFVGGLPYHTTDQSLREFFDKFGEIDEAVVITDRQTGKSRGYGFVTMSDREGADRACKDPNPIIDGRKANVNLAYLGAKPRGNTIQTALPFALKAGIPGVPLGQLAGYPQYMYPSAYISAPSLMSAMPQHAALSQSACQYIDYASPYMTGQYANGYEAYPYTSAAANGFINPAAAYTYSVQQPLTAAAPAAHLAAHYQPQPERLQ